MRLYIYPDKQVASRTGTRTISESERLRIARKFASPPRSSKRKSAADYDSFLKRDSTVDEEGDDSSSCEEELEESAERESEEQSED